eukprot:849892-Pleurochrysis_carterae.AAC.2
MRAREKGRRRSLARKACLRWRKRASLRIEVGESGEGEREDGEEEDSCQNEDAVTAAAADSSDEDHES